MDRSGLLAWARTGAALALTIAATAACGDDGEGPRDGGPADGATPDGGGEDGAIRDGQAPDGGTLANVLPGLTGDVEVVRDDRGMWHIYAASDEDAIRVQGYLMAQDRAAQMELFRRQAKGTLSEFAGSIDPSLIEDDIQARFAGHRRNAEKIMEVLGDEDRRLLEAFSEGISVWFEKVRSGEERLPQAARLLSPELFVDWTPIDTLSMVRFMTASLSFDPNDDVSMTEGLVDYRSAFPADSDDPRVVARAGGYHDFFPYRPVYDTAVIPEFPNVASDTGTRALRPPPSPRTVAPTKLPSRHVLSGARRFLERFEEEHLGFWGDRWRGSNSWIVSGSETETGNPILANDPHLTLTSPPLFWHVHMNTKDQGGSLNVQGLALVGAPGILLGFNDSIAWGLTTTGYDVTDVYREVITPGADGEPDTVELDGEQIAIETIEEEIRLDNGTSMTVTFENVPHHGLIVPDSRTDTEALSVKWTGNEATNELLALLLLNQATSVGEAEDALDNFGVGGQCFVVIDRAGDIFYTSQIDLPIRPAAALSYTPDAPNYDPETLTGAAPSFVLDGTGPHEWQGNLSDRFIPHALNPDKGWIATANGDAVGVTADGNPFNDEHYIGWTFNSGFRIHRIDERLTELAAAGDITVDQMKELQGDHKSPWGTLARDALVAELDRAIEEMGSPGTHPDLMAVVDGLDDETKDMLRSSRDRLAAWTLETPAALEGEPTAAEVADSVASTIFNVAFGRIARLLLNDEYAVLGRGANHDERIMLWSLTDADSLATYDSDLGDTVLWDDLATEDRQETRGEMVVRGFAMALGWLSSELGATMEDWRWGELHTVRFDSIVPTLGDNPISIPPEGSDRFPNGFPRHGDRGVVDASSFGLFGACECEGDSCSIYDGCDPRRSDFAYGSGPQQRLVVEMTPEGPNAWNAMPGGQVLDPMSEHHADEAELWRMNEAPPVYFTDEDVEAHAEETFTIEAAP